MKILLDECVRKEVLSLMVDLDVEHVRDMGWDSLRNGELLRKAAIEFDLMITVDKNMRYQQSIKGVDLAIFVLDVLDVEVETYGRFLPAVRGALADARPGSFKVISDPGK